MSDLTLKETIQCCKYITEGIDDIDESLVLLGMRLCDNAAKHLQTQEQRIEELTKVLTLLHKDVCYQHQDPKFSHELFDIVESTLADSDTPTHQSEWTDDIRKVGELLRSQDNRITDQPLFIVEREVVDWGFDSDYAHDYKWISVDGDIEKDEEEIERLDELDSNDEATGDWYKCYYIKRWEFVTACFTEQGCKDYIAANGHNIGKSRIYADGSYRNFEYQAVRNFLLSAPPTVY